MTVVVSHCLTPRSVFVTVMLQLCFKPAKILKWCNNLDQYGWLTIRRSDQSALPLRMFNDAQGRIQDLWKCFRCVEKGVRFADFIYFFLNIL